MLNKCSDQTLLLGEDGEKYRWFLLPSEATDFMSNGKFSSDMKFSMPFFPGRSIPESKFNTKKRTIPRFNNHFCGCSGLQMNILENGNNFCDKYTDSSEADESRNTCSDFESKVVKNSSGLSIATCKLYNSADEVSKSLTSSKFDTPVEFGLFEEQKSFSLTRDVSKITDEDPEERPIRRTKAVDANGDNVYSISLNGVTGSSQCNPHDLSEIKSQMNETLASEVSLTSELLEFDEISISSGNFDSTSLSRNVKITDHISKRSRSDQTEPPTQHILSKSFTDGDVRSLRDSTDNCEKSVSSQGKVKGKSKKLLKKTGVVFHNPSKNIFGPATKVSLYAHFLGNAFTYSIHEGV